MKESHNRKAAQPDSIRNYLQQISRYPLLTPEQEITLSRQVQRMLELDGLDRELTPDERRERMRGERARTQMINCNLRLVVHIAKKYARRCKFMTLDDLVQEGANGLSTAVRKYDYSRGYKFSTYSYWWVRQSMARAISNQERCIRLPVHMEEQVAKLRGLIVDYQSTHNRRPPLSWLAEQMGATPEHVELVLRMDQHPTSIDRPIADELNLVDILPAPVEHEPQVHEEWEVVEALLKQLTDHEQEIIRLRYGYGPSNGAPMTLQAIANIHGVSRERIRQIVSRAEGRLRALAANRPAVRELVMA
jgi:RNA polymerase sigma factor (sigma-70 family)